MNCQRARVLLLVASEEKNVEASKKLQKLNKDGCPQTATTRAQAACPCAQINLTEPRRFPIGRLLRRRLSRRDRNAHSNFFGKSITRSYKPCLSPCPSYQNRELFRFLAAVTIYSSNHPKPEAGLHSVVCLVSFSKLE